jgi:HD superfamily phosphohydrolase YqeK
MQLTEQSAELFAKELFSKMKGVEKRFITQHTKGIVKTSVNLAKGKKVDLNSLKTAGWLHDIGRTVSIENHAQISVKLAEERFGPLNKVVKDCILNHGSSKDPETAEGKIIQLADKLSIMNDFRLFKIIFAKEKYKEKSLEMVKMVADDLLEVLKRYKWE